MVIFDCNGVLVDSEPLAAQVASREFMRVGFALTPDIVARYFTGRRPAAMFAEVETAARRKLPELLAPLAARRPRIDGMPPIRFPVVNWVRPRLLAEVEFFEILSDGMITRPMFKGLAGDEDARSVHLELTA